MALGLAWTEQREKELTGREQRRPRAQSQAEISGHLHLPYNRGETWGERLTDFGKNFHINRIHIYAEHMCTHTRVFTYDIHSRIIILPFTSIYVLLN